MGVLASIIAVATVAAVAGLIYALARAASQRSAEAAREATKAEMDREATQAEKRAGSVMAEHRDRSGTADRLHNGGF